jgi:hypothetical protein
VLLDSLRVASLAYWEFRAFHDSTFIAGHFVLVLNLCYQVFLNGGLEVFVV